MLWQKCKAIRARPSELIGLKKPFHHAYWFDEAVIYFGLMLENMLEEAGHKPDKKERKLQRDREEILGKVMGTVQKSTGYADPALMFK